MDGLSSVVPMLSEKLAKEGDEAGKLFFKRVPFLSKPTPPAANVSHERAELPTR